MFKRISLFILIFTMAFGGFVPFRAGAAQTIDAAMTALSASPYTDVKEGDTIKITYSVKNKGDVSIADFNVRLNISSNATITKTYTYHRSDSLAPQETFTVTINHTLTKEDVQYYILSLNAVIDIDNELNENEKNNNWMNNQVNVVVDSSLNKPNLAIHSINDSLGWDKPKVGEKFTVYTTVVNTGYQAVSNIKGKLQIGSQTYTYTIAYLSSADTGDGSRGDDSPVFSYTVQTKDIVDGKISIISTIDYNNNISEVDENNNTYTKTITLGDSEKPDLTITGIKKIPAGVGKDGIRVEYKNIGAVNSKEGFRVKLDEPASNFSSYRTVNKLAEVQVNEERYEDFEVIVKDGAIFKATIDSLNIISESNEDNNTYTKVITAGDNSATGNVELFFKDIIADVGGATVKYGNLGPDVVNGGFSIELTDGQTTLRNNVPEGEKIASGEITSTFFNLSPGTHTVKVTIDVDNDITEGDEDNNMMTKVVTIGGDSQNYTDASGITYYQDKDSVGPLPSGYNEWVVVNATTNGSQIPVVSEYQYKGVIEVMMNGIIKASGTSISDAYYILTDYDGNKITPTPAKEFGLYVNGKRLADFWPQAYIEGSQYVFKANIGSNYQNIKFFINDDYRSDNSGSFKLAIKGDSKKGSQIQDISNDYTPSAPIANNSSGSGDIDKLVLKLQRTISALEQKVVDLENRLVTKIDAALSNRLKGKILLQVEENGEAWYVDPESENKFYMKDGQSSYDIMRTLGLGITNKDLESIPIGIQENIYTLQDTDGDKIPDNLEVAIGTDPNKADTDDDGYDDKTEILSGYRPDSSAKFNFDQSLINRLQGRITLQVESHGEAWYINPDDGHRYYLGDGNTAYNIMRFLSLGISNEDLRKIQVGEYN